jgi:ubiquinone/menaquinone biosynthesis C-methylase UbiE
MSIAKDFSPGLSHPYYFIRRGILSGIRKFAPELNGKLLDFGCGSKPYRSLFNVTEYIGLDFPNPGHDHSKEDIDVLYDGKKIPFPDNYFDAVLCSEVFEHIFNLDGTVGEINRVLRPGVRCW